MNLQLILIWWNIIMSMKSKWQIKKYSPFSKWEVDFRSLIYSLQGLISDMMIPEESSILKKEFGNIHLFGKSDFMKSYKVVLCKKCRLINIIPLILSI